MGKKKYNKQRDISTSMTDNLAIKDLYVLNTSSRDHYYAVHKRYFSDEKLECPACGSTKTRCSKVVSRHFNDILLYDSSPVNGNDKNFHVIDLTFYQRYFRCEACGNIVFPEPIDFGNKGCRYTNRLSDVLAEGTLQYSYKKVCEYYGVPASTASVGPIMRRRIQYKESLLPPFKTPKAICIIEISFFRETYPILLALHDQSIYVMDILRDSSEETLLSFLLSLDTSEVNTVYIDPVDSIRAAAANAFPRANLVVTDECLQRYAKIAMLDIIHEDGKRFPIKFKDDRLTMPNKHLPSDYERSRIQEGLKNRPRLKAAYDFHQSFLALIAGEWSYEELNQWAAGLPKDLSEFWDLVDIINLFEREINEFVSAEGKPPEHFISSIQGVCEAFDNMPYGIFEVLKARCLLSITPDVIEENGVQLRLGIHVNRLTENMTEISNKIKEAREYGI